MDSSEEDSDHSEAVVTPAQRARAALLVARFAAAIQATKELQALHNRPRLLALEELVLDCLDTGDAATFLNQKNLFRMMPGRLMEKIFHECSRKWRQFPLVGVMVNPHMRHLFVDLDKPWNPERREDGWTLQELDQLCDDVAREGKTSLRSLEIESSRKPEGKNPGLRLTQLCSLLLELRALTSLHIMGLRYLQTHEIDLLVSTLATTNPDIRSLRLPYLSNKSLCKIADRWPQLEALQADKPKFNESQLEAVLPRLRNLEKLEVDGMLLSEVMMSVARAHDPASPPYKLAEGFCSNLNRPPTSGDMVKLFTAFPALNHLTILETDIPAVCAGLQGREHVHITELDVEPTSANPRALEPLLALIGQHLVGLDVSCDRVIRESRADLNMIGHYCPKLESISVFAEEFISSDEFEVTETHYSKLTRCFLIRNSVENDLSDLPTELVCRVLASPTLESVDMRGVPITEEVVAALAEERGRGALSSLGEVTLFHVPSLDVGVLAALVSHAPRLSVTLDTLDKKNVGLLEIKGVLSSFVQQSGLKTGVYINQY